MKNLFALCLILVAQNCWANMASPYIDGSMSSAAFSSRNIDVLKEKIRIVPNSDLQTALFHIEYTIQTDTGGIQIPLLFHALDYSGGFTVWVDDQLVNVLPVPVDDQLVPKTLSSGFSNIFKGQHEVAIAWDEHYSDVYRINDLKYFETMLSKGTHRIVVEYKAKPWVNRQQWVREYSFEYSLSPAKFWKSFGELEITVDASHIDASTTTNLGNPASGSVDAVAVWKFDSLPGEKIQISCVPKIGASARMLLNIGTTGITWCFAILAILLHFLLIRRYRKNHPQKKYSQAVIVGSILIPLAIVLFNWYAYDIIDNAIGIHASSYRGYNFTIFLYPIVMPFYWIAAWLIDKAYKRNLQKTA
ncbi:MAG TPA: hypothetical protein VLC98_14100 [Phnomibacter sp.]|nr:hypothetical protein [Phnomibacter sp.]